MALWVQSIADFDAAVIEAVADDAVFDAAGDGLAPVAVRGVFDMPWREPEIGRLRTRVLEPTFTGAMSDLDSAISGTSLLTVEGKTYRVIDTEPGDDGIMKLVLRPE